MTELPKNGSQTPITSKRNGRQAMRWLKVMGSFVLVASTLAARGALAQVLELHVELDGAFCAGCALGIKNAVKRVEGVKKVEFRPADGIVHIEPAKGKSIPAAEVKAKLEEGGFRVKRTSVTALGKVVTRTAIQQRGNKKELALLKILEEATSRDGVKLPNKENALLLQTKEPDHLFFLLSEPDKSSDATARLKSALGNVVLIHGVLPQATKRAEIAQSDALPFVAVWVEKVDPVNAAPGK